MMIQAELKAATQADHERLEQLMFVEQVMNGTLSFNEYKRLLVINYLVHHVLEEQLVSALNPAIAAKLQMNSRLKLIALRKDVEEAGVILPESINYYEPLPVTNDAFNLGALYVLEGATLGGSVIIKKLLQNVNLQPYQLNYHYYNIYGNELIFKWKQFCEILNQLPDEEVEQAKAGAKSVFEHYMWQSEYVIA
jgi:heme oxygenase